MSKRKHDPEKIARDYERGAIAVIEPVDASVETMETMVDLLVENGELDLLAASTAMQVLLSCGNEVLDVLISHHDPELYKEMLRSEIPLLTLDELLVILRDQWGVSL